MSTPSPHAALRERLQQRAAALVTRDEALQKHLRGADGRLEADFADRVSFNQMDEVIEKLDDEARAELQGIRQALHRMDEGTYGTCARCGSTIPAARLDAVPATALCITCASA